MGVNHKGVVFGLLSRFGNDSLHKYQDNIQLIYREDMYWLIRYYAVPNHTFTRWNRQKSMCGQLESKRE